jgi:putative acetyltransferase
MIIRANIADMPTVAALHRAVRVATMPYLHKEPSLEAGLRHFREAVFPASDIRLAADPDGLVVGYIAFRDGWVDHLYVAPGRQRRGIGTLLLACAIQGQTRVRTRVFQRNAAGIGFCTARGFKVVDRSEGDANPENEPDLLMEWQAAG